MNYIVLDLEWNQPVNAKSMLRSPISLYGEIIQIGAVKLDEHYHILDTFKIMVAPKYYRMMHKKVTKLTKITTEDLQYGFPFPVAMKHFKKWCGEEFAFLTWGTDDIGILNDNMVLHKMDTSWVPSTYNIQVIFDNQITKEKRQVSLSYAMERIGEPALEAHDALHDARNTVCVCLHLDMVKGLAEYAELQKHMRIGCIKTARDAYMRIGEERYKEAIRIIVEAWGGEPDSFRAENVIAVTYFVDLYHGQYDKDRLVARLRGVDPLTILREGRAMGVNMTGYKKYLYQVFRIYNGSRKKTALPLKF